MTIQRRYFEVVDRTALSLCASFRERRDRAYEQVTNIAREHGFAHVAVQESPMGLATVSGFMRPVSGLDLSRYRVVARTDEHELIYMPQRRTAAGKALANKIERYRLPHPRELLASFDLSLPRLRLPGPPPVPSPIELPWCARIRSAMTLSDWEVREGKRHAWPSMGWRAGRFFASMPESARPGAPRFPGHPWLRERSRVEVQALLAARTEADCA